MQKRLNRVFQLIAWSLVLPQISWAQSTSDDATTIFKKSSNTVITIEAADQDGVRQGSAVAIRNTRNFQTLTPDGTIFYTNWHVVKAAKKISSLIDGQRYNLEIRFGDPKLDMASIKLSGLVIEPAKVTESIPAVGEVVYAIGSPRGLKNSISQGIVSGLRQDGGRQLIQTTAPISPGSSGGGLFDKNSKLVGITTLRVGQAGEALNFSIPFESFQRLEDANMAAEEIASVFKRFFRGAEASIALTQQNEFARWLYEPQQKKVRDYFAHGMVNEAIAAGTDLDQLRKVFTQAQGTAKEVLDNYRADQKQAVAEAGAQESEGKTTLVCVIKNVGTYTLILDSVNKTVNGRPAAFTDTRIEFGDDVAQLVLDRYASTLTFTNRSGSAQADCRRPDKRAF